MNRKQKPLTLSLIIPVYNEENYLGECLRSIAEQTVMPLEVIVVDNNSTDNTTLVAKEFDFVRLISEKRQHQAYAQYAGFEAARGDILGRIDGDTILPKDWVERTLGAFKAKDMVGVSGSGIAYDIILKRFGEFIFKSYYKVSGFFAGHKLMWGANCAFRRDTWKLIKDELLLRPDIWEDYDLGFCLAKHGSIGSMDNPVGVSYRAIHRPPVQQAKYHARSVRTFYLHRGPVVASLFGLIWTSILLVGPIVLFDYYILKPLKNTSVIKLYLQAAFSNNR